MAKKGSMRARRSSPRTDRAEGPGWNPAADDAHDPGETERFEEPTYEQLLRGADATQPPGRSEHRVDDRTDGTDRTNGRTDRRADDRRSGHAGARGEERAPERILFRLRRQARWLIWPALLLIVTSAALAFFAGNLPETWQENLLLIGAGAIVVFGCVLPFLGWLTRRYTVTTRRIILRRGLFTRERQELLHSRGYDLTVRRSWAQTVFSAGDVRINTGLDHPVVLRDIPNPVLVQTVLHDLMEENSSVIAARRQSGASTAGDDTVMWGRR